MAEVAKKENERFSWDSTALPPVPEKEKRVEVAAKGAPKRVPEPKPEGEAAKPFVAPPVGSTPEDDETVSISRRERVDTTQRRSGCF